MAILDDVAHLPHGLMTLGWQHGDRMLAIAGRLSLTLLSVIDLSPRGCCGRSFTADKHCFAAASVRICCVVFRCGSVLVFGGSYAMSNTLSICCFLRPSSFVGLLFLPQNYVPILDMNDPNHAAAYWIPAKEYFPE